MLIIWFNKMFGTSLQACDTKMPLDFIRQVTAEAVMYALLPEYNLKNWVCGRFFTFLYMISYVSFTRHICLPDYRLREKNYSLICLEYWPLLCVGRKEQQIFLYARLRCANLRILSGLGISYLIFLFFCFVMLLYFFLRFEFLC